MNTTLITAGLVCVLAALIGGGLKGFGIEFPLIPSLRRQIVLGLIGGVLFVAGYRTDVPKVTPKITPEPIQNTRCNAVPNLRLNEICAEGKDCDGREDFVEIYNPADSQADLSCFAVVDKKQHRKLLSGTLGAKAVRGWKESELGFGFSSKQGDKVSLMKVQQGGGESVDDSREITESNSYQQRIPDGESWEVMAHERIKQAGMVGSLNERNRTLSSK